MNGFQPHHKSQAPSTSTISNAITDYPANDQHFSISTFKTINQATHFSSAELPSMLSRVILSALAFAVLATAHVEVTFPPPFRSQYNPHYAGSSLVDYSTANSPLNASGSNFPCKGRQVDMNDSVLGASTATWTAGADANFTLLGSATHFGGSGQAAFSYDQGKSFKVVHSWIGSFPLETKYSFTVPSDAPTGPAMFAWTWYNDLGHRELYMECSSITIAGTSARDAPAVAFASRPDILVANLDNGCTTPESKDVIIPNPGPDVTIKEGPDGPPVALLGTCKAVNGIGGEAAAATAGSSSSASTAAAAAVIVAASSSLSGGEFLQPSSTGSSFITQSPASTRPGATAAAASSPSSITTVVVPAQQSTAAAAAASSSSPTPAAATAGNGTLQITTSGECSGSQTCKGSFYGQCCSQWGYCGVTDEHCGTGCQAEFGTCGGGGMASSSSSGTTARRHARSHVRGVGW